MGKQTKYGRLTSFLNFLFYPIHKTPKKRLHNLHPVVALAVSTNLSDLLIRGPLADDDNRVSAHGQWHFLVAASTLANKLEHFANLGKKR